MKTKVLSLMVVFLLGVFSVFAEEKTETINVKGGACDECKEHIETVVTGVDGVTSAKWNVETKVLTVVFDDAVVTLDKVQMFIAQGGNDTPKYKAPEKAYDALPECCKYEREE